MAEEKPNIRTTFEYLLETFFRPNTQAKDIKNLLQLNVDKLKSTNQKMVAFLKELKIEKINELIESTDDLEKKMVSKKFSRLEIDAILIVTKIIKTLAGSKGKEKIGKAAKIAVMGLQNAGKTSFINFLLGQSADEKFKETSPTVSVEHSNMKLGNIQLVIWDFGGQESFRKEYLENPDEFFVDTEVLLYIVDSQDDALYADSIDYFNSILEIMATINDKLLILIDMHKFDPDLSRNIDFIVKTQWLEEKLKEICKGYKLPYEIIKTSIFNDVTSAEEPEIAKNLKDIFTTRSANMLETSEIDILKNIMFVQTKIYINLMNSFVSIDNRIGGLEARISGFLSSPRDIQQGSSKQSSPPPKLPGFGAPSIVGADMTIVKELTDMFRKKRMNTQ
ncbi:MAG TPA: ADP-ribosylation factor-like protein [Candidatus Lokiarchaeia archaeon]|nr:ADP-ribosylation factor-like protein [Candidatus Lokiarchaeia archaeon]